jgi:hypothetical protein
MTSGIEIYIRPSGDKILLNFYIPEAVRDKFIAGLREGHFDGKDLNMHLELSVLPDWLTDASERTRCFANSTSLHVRVPVAAINTHFDE